MDNLPRKIKKRVLGKRMSKSKLRRLLSTVKVVKEADTCYETTEIFPYLFCPSCGCTNSQAYDHGAPYPEMWVDYHCLRCDDKVAYIDNSPFIHVLQCENFELD